MDEMQEIAEVMGDTELRHSDAAGDTTIAAASSALGQAPETTAQAELEAVRGITKSALGATCTIQALSYTSARNGKLFDGLRITDTTQPDNPAILEWLPSGGIVGLRASSIMADAPGVELALLQLLAGMLTPQKGLAFFAPGLRVQLVSQSPEMIEGSLLELLLYGVVPAAAVKDGKVAANFASAVPDLQTIWELCRHVGVQPTIIGAVYSSDWAARSVSNAERWMPLEDRGKLTLVRALLHCPDALLLYRIGDLWNIPEQRKLIGIVRSFVDGSLDKLTRPLSRHKWCRPRSVIWSTLDPILWSALDGPGDFTLTLESPSSATLSRKDTAFAPDAAQEWEELWRRDAFRRTWDDVSMQPPNSAIPTGDGSATYSINTNVAMTSAV